MAVDVVPSLQVVGAVAAAARRGNANVNAIKGTASRAARFNFFMNFTPVWFVSPANCKRIRVNSHVELQRGAAIGNMVVTFITNGVCWRAVLA